MRLSRTLALLGVLASGGAARAAQPDPVPEASAQQVAAPVAPAASSLPWLGVMVDAGVPGGLVEDPPPFHHTLLLHFDTDVILSFTSAVRSSTRCFGLVMSTASIYRRKRRGRAPPFNRISDA